MSNANNEIESMLAARADERARTARRDEARLAARKAGRPTFTFVAEASREVTACTACGFRAPSLDGCNCAVTS